MDKNGSELNTTVTSICQDGIFEWYLHSFHVPMKLVTCSLAIVTNILVVATIIRCWKFWKYSTGLLMLTLGCMDIIGNVLFIIGVLTRLFEYGFHSVVIFYLCITLSGIFNFMMMLISLNRYALVCKPFSHIRITSRKSTLLQILTIITILPCAFIYYLRNLDLSIPIIWDIIMNCFLSHILPIVVSVVLTILVIREFTKNTSELGESFSTSRHGGRNITKAMIVANVAFILLTLPHVVARVISTFVNWVHLTPFPCFLPVYRFVYNALVLIRDINFSINIFIYAAYIPTFRATMKDLSKCKHLSCSNRHWYISEDQNIFFSNPEKRDTPV